MNKGTLTKRVREMGAAGGGMRRAVFYLRVSTPSQVNTDYNPEGISIPAQREACERKAAELGVEVVDTYVEPGRSATSIEKRPVFQEMIARIKAQGDVDYIIVYHFSRIFRNTIDSVLTRRDLRKLGVRIVSTIMDLGDTRESNMIETIMSAIDEYRMESDGADIQYKMGQKAKNGGTIATAPLGYLNERIEIDGRKVAIATLDPERAPLLRQGFELYSTGQYTAQAVLDQLNAAGLRTRGNRRTPPKPLSLPRFYSILADRYYMGVIEYDGEEYKGWHDPLVTPDLFDRVQRVLALHGGGGTRERVHTIS
ncbi:MAG TPA: recombinase family protein [Actinophytocola sp.]|uniref:recombinase family protein n=1 Tax=Actinophytocola sp. TaxID=1872138 RepID=UPI002DDD249F|nr:recombinase family protein [Actinophytocola sp.]HEV2782560.1 recombinase family protein [Actinophytocola sp.]